jgi:hypothetical protein
MIFDDDIPQSLIPGVFDALFSGSLEAVDPGDTEPIDGHVFPELGNIIDSFDSVRFENKIHVVTQERTTGRVSYHVFDMVAKAWAIVNQLVITSNSDGDIAVTIAIRSNGEPVIAFMGDREYAGPADWGGWIIAAAGFYTRAYVTRRVDDVWTTPEMLGSPNELTATFFPYGVDYNGAVNVGIGRAIAEADNWVRFVFSIEEPADVASNADLYTQLLKPDDTLATAHEFQFCGGQHYTPTHIVGDPCVFEYDGTQYTAVPVGLLYFPAVYIWQGTGTLGNATYQLFLYDFTTLVQVQPDTYCTHNPPFGVRWFNDKLYVVSGSRVGSTAEWAVLKTISPPFSEIAPSNLTNPRDEQVGPTWPNGVYARHGVTFANIHGRDYLFKVTTGNFGVPGSDTKSILEKIDLDADVPGDNDYTLAEWLVDNA